MHLQPELPSTKLQKDNIICILPKTKKFGCVGWGDLTLLLYSKVVKQIKVRRDLSTKVEENKSFTSRPSGM